MIEADKLTYAYEKGATAVDGVSFSVEPCERVVLLGSNGCGKSTLLKLLNGLIRPGSGEIRYCGEELTPGKLKDRSFCRRFRSEVGMVFQNPDAMLFNATVRDEIAYGLQYQNRADIDEQVRMFADHVGIAHKIDTPPYQLSGGEKQRLCLAAVLALNPQLLLLDEPTANLDPRTSGWFIDFLAESRNLTTIVSTHNLSLASELGERAIVLGEEHCVLYDGPLNECLSDTELLWHANLAHRHRHQHGDITHRHVHLHGEWD